MFPFGAKNAVFDPGLRGLAAVRDLTDVRCLSSLIIFMAASIPSLWSSSLRAVCSAVWHWRLLAPHHRWALSHFCASWLASSARDEFAHDVGFALHGEVEAFALAALACAALFSHRQVLFVSVHAASEDGVVACIRKILVFSRSFHS